MSRIKMTKSDEKFIRENFENADELINLEDVNDLLYALFHFQQTNGMAPPDYYYPNELGEKVDDVYYSIYNLN